MKLNRRVLRKLIQEEIENLDYKRTKNVNDSPIEYDTPADVKRHEDSWSGGDTIHVNADHLKDYGSKEKSVLGLERLIQKADIKESSGYQSGENVSIGEYKLSAMLALGWEKETLQQNYQGTGPEWASEVDKAAAELEEALIDAGVLINVSQDVLKLINAIDEKLHNGEYAMQRDF